MLFRSFRARAGGVMGEILSGQAAQEMSGAFLDDETGACQASCRCAKKESDNMSLNMLYP